VLLKTSLVVCAIFAFLFASPPPPPACANLCKVNAVPLDASNDPGFRIIWDPPVFPGHGVCECLFTSCLQSSGCSETILVTFVASPGWQLCKDAVTSAGQNETVALTVLGCGDSDTASFDVCPNPGKCGCPIFSWVKFDLWCLACEGTCQF